MALLSIWTGAWVSRAGILAEVLSFLLIAPEILGRERLNVAQQTLDELFRRMLRPSQIWATKRYVPVLPGLVSDDPDAELLAGLASVIITVMYYAIYIPLLVAGSLPDETLFALAILAGVLGANLVLGTAAVSLVRWKGSVTTVRYIGYGLGIPAAPVTWTLAVVQGTIIFALRMLARAGVALLARPGGLRGVVFSAGVLLLVGGLAAQFVATF